MAREVFAVGASDAVAITKSDATEYTPQNGGYLDALYVGGAGDVTVKTVDGSTVAFVGAVAGSILPIQCQQVRSATTATSIVGLRFSED
jgi:hypothetical protein